MEDSLEASMKAFIEQLKQQLPQQITIAQEVDVGSLQKALEDRVQQVFEQNYRGTEAGLTKEIEDMKAAVGKKIQDLRTNQEIQQKSIRQAMEGLKEQQANQDGLLRDIAQGITVKQAQAQDSQRSMNGQIEHLYAKVVNLYEQAQGLYSNIQKRRQKAVLGEEINPIGRGYYKVIVQNLKNYCLENIVLTFRTENSQQETVSGFLVPVQDDFSYLCPLQTAEMKAEVPELFDGTTYSVTISRNGEDISNTISCFT